MQPRIIREEPAIPMRLSKKPRLFAVPPRSIIVGENEASYEEYLKHITIKIESKEIEVLAVPGGDKIRRVAIVALDWPEEQKATRVEQRMPKLKKILQTVFIAPQDLALHEKNFQYIKYNPKQKLFGEDNKVSPEDIVQGPFGNCFLLSAAGVLAKFYPDFLKNLFKIQTDGSIIVTLFDPITQSFQGIQVENSYLSQDGTPVVQHKKPWVHILEKAYAVLASKGDNQTAGKRGLFPSFFSIFTGDSSSHALYILTGKRRNDAFHQLRDEYIDHPCALLFSQLRTKEIEEKKNMEEKEEKEKNLSKTIFGEEIGNWQKLSTNPNNIKKIKEIMKNYRNIIPSFKWNITKNQFDESNKLFLKELKSAKDENGGLIFTENLIPKLASHLDNFSKENFDEKQHGYHSSLIKIYTTISKSLEEKKLVTACSLKLSAAEINTSGIAGEHAYMVMGVRNDEKLGYLIRLRNPWGSVGRSYIQKTGTQWEGQLTQDAEFEIRLIDFPQYFSYFEVGECSELPTLKIAITIRNFPIVLETLSSAFKKAGLLKDAKNGDDIISPKIQKFIDELELDLDGLNFYLHHILSIATAKKIPLPELDTVFTLIKETEKTYVALKQPENMEEWPYLCQVYLQQLTSIYTLANTINEKIDTILTGKKDTKADSKEIKPLYTYSFAAKGWLNEGLGARVEIANLMAKNVLTMSEEEFLQAFPLKQHENNHRLCEWIQQGIILATALHPTESKVKSSCELFTEEKEYTNSNDLLGIVKEYEQKGYALHDLVLQLSNNENQIVFFAKKIPGQTYFYIFNTSPISVLLQESKISDMLVFDNLENALITLKAMCPQGIVTALTTNEQYEKAQDFTLLQPLITRLPTLRDKTLDENYKSLQHIIYHLTYTVLEEGDKNALIHELDPKTESLAKSYIEKLNNELKKLYCNISPASERVLERLKKHTELLLKKITRIPDNETVKEFMNAIQEKQAKINIMIEFLSQEKINTSELQSANDKKDASNDRVIRVTPKSFTPASNDSIISNSSSRTKLRFWQKTKNFQKNYSENYTALQQFLFCLGIGLFVTAALLAIATGVGAAFGIPVIGALGWFFTSSGSAMLGSGAAGFLAQIGINTISFTAWLWGSLGAVHVAASKSSPIANYSQNSGNSASILRVVRQSPKMISSSQSKKSSLSSPADDDSDNTSALSRSASYKDLTDSDDDTSSKEANPIMKIQG